MSANKSLETNRRPALRPLTIQVACRATVGQLCVMLRFTKLVFRRKLVVILLATAVFLIAATFVITSGQRLPGRFFYNNLAYQD